MGNIFAFIQDPDGKLWKLNFKSIQADSSTSSRLNLTYVIMTHTQDSSTKWSNTLPIRGMPTRSACAAWKPLMCRSVLDYYTRNHTSTCTQCTSMGYLVNQGVNSTAFARATKEFIQTHRQGHFYSVLHLKGFTHECCNPLNSMLAHHLLVAQFCFLYGIFLKNLGPCEPTSSDPEMSGRICQDSEKKKKEKPEEKGLQPPGGRLIKNSKLTCSAFQTKQWKMSCLPAEWEASRQTAIRKWLIKLWYSENLFDPGTQLEEAVIFVWCYPTLCFSHFLVSQVQRSVQVSSIPYYFNVFMCFSVCRFASRLWCTE